MHFGRILHLKLLKCIFFLNFRFKMKFYIITFVCLIAYVVAEEQYTTKYDGVNLDEILKSDRLFNNYYKCLMDQGRCTPDGKLYNFSIF